MSANSDRRHLPEEIVIEILSRLSVKSLLRFMCVCKLWYILIKSPSFINKHFYQENNQCPLLVHRHKYRNNKYIFSLFPDVTFGCEAPIFEEPDYLQMPGFPLVITGPMNGVFCLCNGDGVALWNPATREFRPLPAPPHLDVPSHLTELWHSFGFGLDPLTNCYKVVWFRCCWDEETDSLYHHESVPVYAQDSDSWRYLSLDVPSFTTVDHESFSNTYVNGSYYWLLKIGNPSELLVLSFDMGSDEFKKIQAPDDPNRRQSALALYNDSIALFFYEYGEIETIVDIWVMKQEEGCWVKHLTVGPLLQIRWPAGFWKNDQIFLENNTSDLVLYDPNPNMIHNLGIRKDEAAFACFRVCAYKESLVSIKEGNKDWELDKWSDIVHEFFREPSPNT